MPRRASLTGVINAAKAWDAPMLKQLLAQEPAFVTATDRTGRSPLHYVATADASRREGQARHSIAAARVLVDAGADIDAVHEIPEGSESFSATPVWTAYARGRNGQLLDWLLKQGATPNHTLWACAWFRDTKTAEKLLKHGAEIDPVFHGLTPFLEAVGWRRLPFAACMARHGADLDFRNRDGDAALHVALRKKFKLEELKQLLAMGCNPDTKNGSGESARDMAARLNKTGALKLMAT